MSAASKNSELYRDQQSSVSPLWLINGKSRYAMRTVVKLEFHKIIRPRARALFMLLLGSVMSIVSIRYILIDARPYLIPYIMLAGSVTLMTGGACVLYLAQPRFRLDMTLRDGSCVSLLRKRRVDAEGLLASLNIAMDRHLSAEAEAKSDLQVQSLSQVHRVKQAIARSSGRRTTESRSLSSHQPVTLRPVVSPVVVVEPASIKAHLNPLLSLLSLKRLRRPVD